MIIWLNLGEKFGKMIFFPMNRYFNILSYVFTDFFHDVFYFWKSRVGDLCVHKLFNQKRIDDFIVQ